jgi:hypothetical protein
MRLPLFPWAKPVSLLVALCIGVGAGVWVMRPGGSFRATPRTTLEQSVVVDRVVAVAKLITSEAMLRDVVTYENTSLGSTKRSLVIVTGKAMVGIDLARPPEVSIDAAERRISLTLPHARLLGIDITQMNTYDESRGLWNPFHPADRDTIFTLARRQLTHAAADLDVIHHAEESARTLLNGLFAQEGYTVDVSFAP